VAETDPIAPRSIGTGLDGILDKSCALMAQKGFHGTTMRDISAETGRSLAGLYHYFRSKDDLLFLINYHGFQTLNDTWTRMNKEFGDPEEKLYGFIYLHTRYFSEHINAMRVMTWGTQSLSLENAKVIEQLKSKYTRAASQVVRQVYPSDSHLQLDKKRLDRETYILFGMMNWLFSWYSPKQHGSARQLIADIFSTFAYGLGSRGVQKSTLERMDRSVTRWFEQNGAKSMW
jgi:AcrR family transcriptional regulator